MDGHVDQRFHRLGGPSSYLATHAHVVERGVGRTPSRHVARDPLKRDASPASISIYPCTTPARRAAQLDDTRRSPTRRSRPRCPRSSARRSSVQDVELAEPKAGEVLVRLVACGVCHTDLYTASGADPSGYAPTVLGHEGAGVVEAVGPGVSSLAPGDHVVTLFSPQCRECAHCLDERTNLCLAIREQQNLGFLPDGTTRLSRGGEPIRHFMGTSTFAEHTVMPEIALAKITPEAPLDHACVFACGLSTGLGAAMNTAKVQPGSTCVVFGAGLVGLGAVAGCRLQGAERIVAVDLSADRLELARGQGATDVLTGGPDTVQQILDLTEASAPTTPSRRPGSSR